jgi:hypothetical protein
VKSDPKGAGMPSTTPSTTPKEQAPAGGGPRGSLPSGAARNRVLWYGGLAALAALDVLEWPVAAAVAAGSYVAEQRARSVLRPRPSAVEVEASGQSAG